MSILFEETAINGMNVRNRIIRSATWEGMCEADGRPTEKLINLYRVLAQGGIGMIISGYTFIRREGKQMPGKMGIHTDDFESEMVALSSAVHDKGGKICIQLVHAGGQTSTEVAGRKPLAPSTVQVDQFSEIPSELSKNDILDIVEAFEKGASRAKRWGFDAVQLHGAHGYLINQFLSPLTNRRTDKYGGSIENRSRFLMKVYEKVRETVGEDYPVLIKLNAADNIDGGLEVGDAVYAAEKLSKEGIDAIEVSAGTPASGIKNPARLRINKPEKEAYHLELARQIMQGVSCPVMVVGGFRSFDVAEKAIKNHGMDYIAMSRPLIREPHLPNRWQNGDRRPAKCISCNGCFKPGLEEGGIYCVIEKKEREKTAQN